MIDEKILITLMGLQNEALKQIAIEQRGGRAIKEEEIAPCPDWQDFRDERLDLLDVPKGETLEEMVRAEEMRRQWMRKLRSKKPLRMPESKTRQRRHRSPPRSLRLTIKRHRR